MRRAESCEFCMSELSTGTSKDNEHVELPLGLEALLARPFERIVVFSGAGMSADSGIPTFRSGSNGLWGRFDPMELATPAAYRRDRDLVWAWYEWRRGLVMAATPHAGHRAAGALQQRLGAALITQNVDDLHERGGATDVLHMHGSLFAARCVACGRPHAFGPPPDTPRERLAPPACMHCGGPVRPGVVWFGESLDAAVMRRALAQIGACDLLLVVGTSGVVQPAASMVSEAPADAVVVEINPEAAAASRRIDFRWATTASRGLPAIAGRLLS
jgi:NAD-dependent deacetylase